MGSRRCSSRASPDRVDQKKSPSLSRWSPTSGCWRFFKYAGFAVENLNHLASNPWNG